MKHSPLSTKALRIIQERNLDNPDAMTLLREIKRLHRLLNNCWQALDTLPPQRLHSSLDLLQGCIDREPCVKDQQAAYARAGRMVEGE